MTFLLTQALGSQPGGHGWRMRAFVVCPQNEVCVSITQRQCFKLRLMGKVSLWRVASWPVTTLPQAVWFAYFQRRASIPHFHTMWCIDPSAFLSLSWSHFEIGCLPRLSSAARISTSWQVVQRTADCPLL